MNALYNAGTMIFLIGFPEAAGKTDSAPSWNIRGGMALIILQQSTQLIIIDNFEEPFEMRRHGKVADEVVLEVGTEAKALEEVRLHIGEPNSLFSIPFIR